LESQQSDLISLWTSINSHR